MNIKIEIKGIREMVNRFNQAPKIVDRELERAFEKSLLQIEREVKKRTPVDSGRLRGSIGGIEGKMAPSNSEGWRYVHERTASIGTRVKYAFWVEVRNVRHKVGEVGFFSKGVAASMDKINEFFKTAMENVVNKLAR